MCLLSVIFTLEYLSHETKDKQMSYYYKFARSCPIFHETLFLIRTDNSLIWHKNLKFCHSFHSLHNYQSVNSVFRKVSENFLLIFVKPNVIILLYRWQKIFSFSVWGKIATFWNKAFLTIIVLLIVLFLGKYLIPSLTKLNYNCYYHYY